jgi:hypothetical protein
MDNKDKKFLDELVKRTSEFTGFNHKWSINNQTLIIDEVEGGPVASARSVFGIRVFNSGNNLHITAREISGRFRNIGIVGSEIDVISDILYRSNDLPF